MKSKPLCYISYSSPEYEELLSELFDITTELKDGIRCAQFTGGSDVTPEFYNERPHPRAYCNPARDALEKNIFYIFLERYVPMMGICRGGQFLNVMCGGKMWQDVDGHGTVNGHDISDIESGRIIRVSSTHHQMMRPSKEATIIAVADKIATRAEGMVGLKPVQIEHKGVDWEVLWYQRQKALCFQPHPEFNPGWEECRSYYLELVNKYIMPGVEKCVV